MSIVDAFAWPESEYARLEDNVRDLVKALHRLGIITVMSCQGHIRTAWYYTGVLPWPWIIIQDKPEKIAVLSRLIEAWNKDNPGKKWILSKDRIHPSFTPEYIVNVMQRDYPGTIVRALVPAEENSDLSEDVLKQLQEQAVAFALFLAQSS